MLSRLVRWYLILYIFFFFQAEDGIRDLIVTGVQTCALPISIGHVAQPELGFRVVGKDERLDAYARLIVRVGLNLQPGQDVQISGFIEHAPLARALARTAYEAGARYVDVLYQDNHIRKALVELRPEESLAWTPPYWMTRLEDIVERRGARIAITGET